MSENMSRVLKAKHDMTCKVAVGEPRAAVCQGILRAQSHVTIWRQLVSLYAPLIANLLVVQRSTKAGNENIFQR